MTDRLTRQLTARRMAVKESEYGGLRVQPGVLSAVDQSRRHNNESSTLETV